MRKVRSDEFTPIPKDQIRKWNALIKKGKALVERHDKAIWELILLVGEVKTEYGDGQIRRFADEIDISEKSVYEYQWLARVGVDREFVEEWSKDLSFSMVRQILRRTGRVDAPASAHFLNYARERKISVRAMDAYMLSTIAPDQYREHVGEEMRLALQHKQEAEGFDDYIKAQLEKIVEDQPQFAEIVMKHSIVTTDDLEALKIQAGISTDEEVEMAGNAKRQADKIKRFQRNLNENKKVLMEHLAYGHENSDELRLHIDKLKDTLEEILATEERQIVIEDADPVPTPKVKAGAK